MQSCSMLHKLVFQEYLVLLYLVLCSLHEKKSQMLFLMTKSGELLLENFWWTSGEIANIGVSGRYISGASISVFPSSQFFYFFLLNKRSSSLFWFIVCKKVYSLLLKLEILYVQPDCYLKALSHSALMDVELWSWYGVMSICMSNRKKWQGAGKYSPPEDHERSQKTCPWWRNLLLAGYS